MILKEENVVLNYLKGITSMKFLSDNLNDTNYS